MTECNKCGECCKTLMFTVSELSNDRLLRIYFKARGVKILKGNKVLVPHRCSHLTEDNLCDVHGTKRQPIICKNFRGQKNYYTPRCCAFHPKNIRREKNGKKAKMEF